MKKIWFFTMKLFIFLMLSMFYYAAECASSDILDDFFDAQFDFHNKKLTPIKTTHTKKNYIIFMQDAEENIFIIKQPKSSDPVRQLRLVSETLGAWVARSIGISANAVRILPPGQNITNKLDAQRPFTIHTLVPGCRVMQLPELGNVYIQQPWKDHWTNLERCGLSFRVLQDMSIHQDLAKIVALDTFIGNNDRARSNLFYDAKSDRFWTFDFESSFIKNLSFCACSLIKKLSREPIAFGSQEWDGLVVYHETLKKLVTIYPPDKLCNMFALLVEQAGIKSGSVLYTDAVTQRLEWYKDTIHQNYASAKELVILLDELMAHQVNNT